MLLTKFQNFAIIGMSVAAPNNLLGVASFYDDFGEESVKNISEMTGIKSFRRALPEQTASDLGYIAANDVFNKTGINKDEIGMLVFITQKPDYGIPSTAFLLHKRLGLGRECICFDINLACSGFVYGIHTVMSMLNSSNKKTALLITGDTTTKTISPYDKTMMLLFGDSGTATIIQKTNQENMVYTALRTDGDRFKAIIAPSGAYRNRNGLMKRVEWSDGIVRSDYDTHMKGMDVFGFSISDVPQLMKEMLESLNTTPESYDVFALHQPNMYMLKKIAHKIKIPNEKLLVSIDRFGNNSSSSIPLVLSDHFGNSTGKSLRTFMCGFGAGLSWGCADITLNTDIIFPIQYSDEYYKEDF